MQFLASLLVAAYVLLYAMAWPVPFSLSRATPQIGSRAQLLSSVEAARTYLHEAETEFFAFTSNGKESSAVTVGRPLSEANARVRSGAQSALTMDRKEMTAEMRNRINEWMRILGEERCGDKSGCE